VVLTVEATIDPYPTWHFCLSWSNESSHHVSSATSMTKI